MVLSEKRRPIKLMRSDTKDELTLEWLHLLRCTMLEAESKLLRLQKLTRELTGEVQVVASMSTELE
jgi:hypothetical protein